MPRAVGRKVKRVPLGQPPTRRRQKHLTAEESRAIVALAQQGTPRAVIASSFTVAGSTVTRVLQRAAAHASGVRSSTHRGHQRLLSPRDERALRRQALRDPHGSFSSYSEATSAATGKTPSPQTVQRSLERQEIVTYNVAKKPLLLQRHRRARIAWARAHLNWTSDKWRSVLFSDETTLTLRGTTHRRKVHAIRGRQLDPQNIAPTEKFGAKTMFWGCFSQAGVGELIRVQGAMDQFKYIGYLRRTLPEARRRLFGGRRFVYQQDNAPCHVARRVKDWISTGTTSH